MTPIYIINRNRLTTTRQLVEWLLKSGEEDITIADNQSTYLPLLEYYETLNGTSVAVRKVDGNYGPSVVWDKKMHSEKSQPYIVTDSDVLPADFCPGDLVTKLVACLNQYDKYNKIGPGIRLDNLPDIWPGKSKVVAWESEFWKKRLDSQCFIAAIDTTFAIYRNEFVGTDGNASLRLDYPYLVEHRPWYNWPLDEEEVYYRDHAENWSTIATNRWTG